VTVAAVTFVTPHQGLTSGGVYVIEQFARRLASTCAVTLVVLSRDTRPVPGVDVVAATGSLRRRVPAADVLVIPADSARMEDLLALRSRAGRPLLLVQSLAHPHAELTRRNLALVRDGVAVSTWLAERAAAAGCRARLVRPGLDRRVFFAPRGAEARGRRVALLVHRDTWKGYDDALAAAREAAARVGDVELHTFGGVEEPAPDVVAHGPVTQWEVAQLLRRTAVFVCASREEGLGLPGLEAMACGAALATTDTGGGRDYAVDGETALVSPPRDPQALADNVVRLLRETDLRRRLAAGGQALVRERYPSWSVAARRLRRALAA